VSERRESNTLNLPEENSMTRRSILWAMARGLLLVIGCGKAEFKEFASAGGRFKVQLPGTPKEENQPSAGLTVKYYSLEERDGGYGVAFVDLPISSGESEAELRAPLDGARNGMLGNVGGTLTSCYRPHQVYLSSMFIVRWQKN
jgi:hypothetical protein